MWHFHEAGRFVATLPLPLRGGLSRRRVVVSLSDNAGTVWLAK